MRNRELKLKQASAVLGVRPKDLQNFGHGRRPPTSPRWTPVLLQSQRPFEREGGTVTEGLARDLYSIPDEIYARCFPGPWICDK